MEGAWWPGPNGYGRFSGPVPSCGRHGGCPWPGTGSRPVGWEVWGSAPSLSRVDFYSHHLTESAGFWSPKRSLHSWPVSKSATALRWNHPTTGRIFPSAAGLPVSICGLAFLPRRAYNAAAYRRLASRRHHGNSRQVERDRHRQTSIALWSQPSAVRRPI